MTSPQGLGVREALRHSLAFALLIMGASLVSRGIRDGWDEVLNPPSVGALIFATLVLAGIVFVISIGVRSLLIHRPVKRHAEEESQDGR